MKHFVSCLLASLIVSISMAQGFKMEGSEVIPEGAKIEFKKGTSTLVKGSEATLMSIKKYLDDKTYISLMRVEGHVDGEGDNNQSLSEARAVAICKWLIAQGIDCKRLIPVGFADKKPVSNESNVLNTRICFVNAGLRGRMIGGMPADGGGKVAGDPCQ